MATTNQPSKNSAASNSVRCDALHVRSEHAEHFILVYVRSLAHYCGAVVVQHDAREIRVAVFARTAPPPPPAMSQLLHSYLYCISTPTNTSAHRTAPCAVACCDAMRANQWTKREEEIGFLSTIHRNRFATLFLAFAHMWSANVNFLEEGKTERRFLPTYLPTTYNNPIDGLLRSVDQAGH